LLSSCDMFEACSSGIEGILVRNADDECLNIPAECSKITSVVSDALSSCKDWHDLFVENNAVESRLSWCGMNLCKCNEDWTTAFTEFLQMLLFLSHQIEQVQEQQQSPIIEELFTHVQKLPGLSEGKAQIFSVFQGYLVDSDFDTLVSFKILRIKRNWYCFSSKSNYQSVARI
uniref:Fanconi anemia group D2 protein n=1 Tax=Gongylonema pulchrum TaxID=637853 RepID=A0A183D7X0_9BILA